MKFFTIIGALVIAIPFLLGIGLAVTLWKSWWLYPVWGWYVVPLGVPEISFWHFAAFVLLVHTLTFHFSDRKDDRPIAWTNVASSLLSPIMVWAILWWLHV